MGAFVAGPRPCKHEAILSNVLVTGAGGCIGSHLVEKLVAEGVQVRAFVEYDSRGSWDWLDDVDPHTRDAIEVIALVPDDRAFDMPELFGACHQTGLTTLAYPIQEYRADIGQLDDYRRANEEFASIF